ncbi:hypothetical protein B0H16DRAFT_1892303 [Mycena metata]|uniref:Uncharacterized protein n=1 Tax=Mycena metata TaxID=1033252 RepID=A0AAD7MXJ4_9AGAR|nr:hypothetical protein B0H16DRAFT_1892303 [Mycena metata]
MPSSRATLHPLQGLRLTWPNSRLKWATLQGRYSPWTPPAHPAGLFRHFALDIIVSSSYGFSLGAIRKWALEAGEALTVAIGRDAAFCPRCPRPRADRRGTHRIAPPLGLPNLQLLLFTRLVAGPVLLLSTLVLFRRHRKVVHAAAYKYPNGETMECMYVLFVLSSFPSLHARSPLAYK